MKNFGECDFNKEKIVYCVQKGERLIDIQEKFGVPLHALIYDNMLDHEVCEGQIILVDKSRGESFIFLPDNENDVSDDIKRYNGVQYVYPFRMLFKP